MSDKVIIAEGVSKSYLVGHNSKETNGYSTFRETLNRNLINLIRKSRDMFRGQDIIQGDEVEEFWALKDINFEINSGDRVGIIGRNGAGKSTLLKILSRITGPTSGQIKINGRVASLLEVGTGFHPELTGRENIFLNGAVLGMSRHEIRRKFDEIVDFAEVEKFLDTPVKRYSSGMYVRLAFAVAAHLEPEILIVDEVLAVGDARFQKKCMGRMSEVSREGRTVLFVSHNMGAISELCSRAILLNEGRVVLDGSVAEAVSSYLQVDGTRESRVFSQKSDHPIYITYMKLIDLNGQKISQSALGEDAILELGFHIKEPMSNVSFAILISRDGMPLLYSHDNDENSSLFDMVREKGSYTARLHLPLSRFKEGSYTIEAHVGAGAVNMTVKDTGISFVIENLSINTYDKGYRSDRPGQLFWPLSWNVNKSESI